MEKSRVNINTQIKLNGNNKTDFRIKNIKWCECVQDNV